MRMAFGLVGLLVTLAIILMLFKTQAPALKAGKKAQDQARQMVGRDEDGNRVTDAVTLDARDRAGKMESVVVSDITPNSAIQQRYGLQKGDVIIQMGDLNVRDNMSSPEEAKDFLLKAYQDNREVVVIRGWDKLTLPMGPGAAPAPANANAPTEPAAQPEGAQAQAPETSQDATAAQPAKAPAKARDNRSAMERQLDLIKNIPGQ